MIIIPIGIDCGLATFLNKHRLRHCSFPFDWNVSYNGVSECFDDNFKEFIPIGKSDNLNKYGIYFNHDFIDSTFKADTIKYQRRINRMIHILEQTKEEIYFCRRGHSCDHHSEQNNKFNTISSEITDAENLDRSLKQKYGTLNYKIHVMLVCSTCFDQKKTYESTSENIILYNIVTPKPSDSVFEKCARQIFNL